MKGKSNETKAEEFIKRQMNSRQRLGKIINATLPGDSQFSAMEAKIKAGK